MHHLRRTKGPDRGIETNIYHSASSGSEFDPRDLAAVGEAGGNAEVSSLPPAPTRGQRLRKSIPVNYAEGVLAAPKAAPPIDNDNGNESDSEWWNEPLAPTSTAPAPKSRSGNALAKRKATTQRRSPAKKQARCVQVRAVDGIEFIRDMPRPVLDIGAPLPLFVSCVVLTFAVS